MRRQLSQIERAGVLLFGGYLLLFLLCHDPRPRIVPGLLAIAPGYLPAAAQFNPLILLHQRLGIAAALFSSIGLLLVLVFLFVVYFRLLHCLRRQAHPDVRLTGILAGVVLFSLPLVLCPYLFSNDIYSYIMNGRIAALYGGNPATTAPSVYAHDAFFPYLLAWQSTPSVYGPVWTLFSHGLTLLIERTGGGLWLYLLAYKLTMLAAHLASTLLIWQIARAWKPGQQVYAALLYAWNPVVLIEFVGSAHNDALMICLVLLAVLCIQRGYWRSAVVALLAAALVKWIAVLLLPLWAIYWLRQQVTWRARLLVAGQLAAIVIIGATLSFVPYGQVLQSVGAPLRAQGAMQAENSLDALVIRAGQEALVRLGIASARAPAWRLAAEQVVMWCSKGLVLLAWLVALYAVWRRPTFERLLQASCWLLLALLLLAPVFRVWYVTWPLALVALLDWRPAGRAIASLVAAAPFLYIQAQSPA
ncbi:MAG: polyprenol phosphomannose-dependent alpha 1,6 mannosyltransferase MptB [Chloroflexota bacterium]|nr:polyprenol phosphomannose-dependent alpha 1,6 mannosyltransferase MptB [Chloroflexota bacterium]